MKTKKERELYQPGNIEALTSSLTAVQGACYLHARPAWQTANRGKLVQILLSPIDNMPAGENVATRTQCPLLIVRQQPVSGPSIAYRQPIDSARTSS